MEETKRFAGARHPIVVVPVVVEAVGVTIQPASIAVDVPDLIFTKYHPCHCPLNNLRTVFYPRS